mmetsp:Transcript_19794/g.44951  ORF Transcript_19794/g.44951 Transcript_19794/m.44951 type:complete len:99 (-) Transcript_19794:1993-2289(-)
MFNGFQSHNMTRLQGSMAYIIAKKKTKKLHYEAPIILHKKILKKNPSLNITSNTSCPLTKVAIDGVQLMLPCVNFVRRSQRLQTAISTLLVNCDDMLK